MDFKFDMNKIADRVFSSDYVVENKIEKRNFKKEDSKIDEKIKFSHLNETEILEDLDLDDELDFEPVSKSNDQQVQNLYDGYIGEKNFIPNPYEYGPNATYRNINEGIVYKKNEQNLWEAFVKDGKVGAQGPRGFAGGGTGVEEVKKIATDISISAVENVVTSANRYIIDSTKYTRLEIQSLIDMYDESFGILVPFGYTLILDEPLIISHKKNVKIYGGGTIRGTVKIGAFIYGDPDPASNINVEDVVFDSGINVWTSGVSNGLNAIELDSLANTTISRVSFRGYDTCVYLSIDQSYEGITRHTIKTSIDDCRTIRDSQPNTSAGRVLTYPNYFVRQANNGLNAYRGADISITNNRVQSSITNVWLYGIDGVTISDNIFFMSSWMDRSQIKEYNIYINAVQWSVISDNKLFEPGLESIRLNKFADISIANNVIAWPGQKSQSYGIRVSGGKNLGSTSGDTVVSSNIIGNKIGRSTGGGIRVDSGCDGINIIGNVGDYIGIVETYYGNGSYSAGPSAVPSLSGTSYSISIDDGCYGINVYGNNFYDGEFDFPASTIDPGNRGYGLHLAGPHTALNVGKYGEYKKVITINNPTSVLNVSGADLVIFTGAAGAPISGINGLIFNKLTTIINFATRVVMKHLGGTSISLQGNRDTIIPYQGRLTVLKAFNSADPTQQRVYEYSRSFDFPIDSSTITSSTRIYSGSQQWVILSGSTSGQTLTLDNNYATHQPIKIINRSTQSWTIAPQSGSTINGAANYVIPSGSTVDMNDYSTTSWIC